MRRNLTIVSVLLAYLTDASRLSTGVAQRLEVFADSDGQVAQEDAASDAEEHGESAGYCTFLSGQNLRTYHFDFTFPDGERRALEMIRHPVNPVLRFYPGRVWSVHLRRQADGYEDLEWSPAVADDAGAPAVDANGDVLVDTSDPISIDIRRELRYIRRIPRDTTVEGSADGLELGFLNESKTVFAGGLYYPENAMLRSVRRLYRQRERDLSNSGVNTTGLEAQNRSAAQTETDSNLGGTVVDAGRSIAQGTYESAKFSAVFAFLGGVLEWQSLGAILTATIGGTTVGGTTLGFAGVTGGAIWGAWAALPFVIPMTVLGSFHAWRHEHHETVVSGSQKVFEKLKCHRMMGICDDSVLYGNEPIGIFAGRPNGDIVIPFGGAAVGADPDVDPITLQPFGDMVSWTVKVNLAGNAFCADVEPEA